MGRVEVYKGKRSGAGCVWILAIPAFLILAVVCCVGTVSIGIAGDMIDEEDLKEASYEITLDGVRSLEANLALDIGSITINQLPDNVGTVMEADIDYIGQLDYSEANPGEPNRIVSITQSESTRGGLVGLINLFQISSWQNSELRWNVDFNPDVPLDLSIDSSAGQLDLNLTALTLTGLNIDLAAGELRLQLPPPVESYAVTLDSSAGYVSITLPRNVPVRIDGEQTVGTIDTDDANLNQISRDEGAVGVRGVWQTPNFDESAPHITITYTGSAGELDLVHE